MTKYTFNFDSRKPIDPSTIKDGDIVAFEWYCEYEETTKKGVACMGTSDFFYAAYNLFRDADDEGGVWVSDELPENITLYTPTKEEFELAIDLFSSYNINYLNYINQDSQNNIEKLKTALREREDRMEKVVELLNAKAKQQSKEIADLSHRLFGALFRCKYPNWGYRLRVDNNRNTKQKTPLHFPEKTLHHRERMRFLPCFRIQNVNYFFLKCCNFDTQENDITV